MIFTAVGLPNSCCVCGKPQKGKWYAENEDEARSGQGMCKRDSKPAPEPPAPKAEVPDKPSVDESAPSPSKKSVKK